MPEPTIDALITQFKQKLEPDSRITIQDTSANHKNGADLEISIDKSPVGYLELNISNDQHITIQYVSYDDPFVTIETITPYSHIIHALCDLFTYQTQQRQSTNHNQEGFTHAK